MKKLPFERQGYFWSKKASEVSRQDQNEEELSSEKVEKETHSRSRMSTTSQMHELPYQKIGASSWHSSITSQIFQTISSERYASKE